MRNRVNPRRRLGVSGDPEEPKMENDPAAPARGKRKLGLNENYARELMELHTLGVDGGYTQQDIVEVARCLTGWTISRPRQDGSLQVRQDPARRWREDGARTQASKLAAASVTENGYLKSWQRTLQRLDSSRLSLRAALYPTSPQLPW